jgi:hypothetical protein
LLVILWAQPPSPDVADNALDGGDNTAKTCFPAVIEVTVPDDGDQTATLLVTLATPVDSGASGPVTINLEPQASPPAPSAENLYLACATAWNGFLGTALVTFVVLVSVLMVNVAAIGKAQTNHQQDQTFRPLQWPLMMGPLELLPCAVLVASALTVVAYDAVGDHSPDMVSGLRSWALTEGNAAASALRTGWPFVALVALCVLTLSNIYVAAVGLTGMARAYPKVAGLTRLRGRVMGELGLEPMAKEAACVALIAKAKPPFELPPNAPHGRMPISTRMKPTHLIKILDILTIPLVIALLAALALAAATIHLVTLDPSLSEAAVKPHNAYRQSWIVLAGVALTLAVTAIYVPLFGRLKTYASAEDDLAKPAEATGWVVSADSNFLVVPVGTTQSLPKIKVERPRPDNPPTFSDDLRRYTAADATKAEIILTAARHGAGIQHLLSENLSGSITKFLAILSPALLGGLLSLL